MKLIVHGITCVKDLVGKYTVGDVKLTEQIRVGVEHHDDIMLKIPRDEITEIAAEFENAARSPEVGGPRVQLTICGSYRRGKASSGDVDCLITVNDTCSDNYPTEVMMRLKKCMEKMYGDRLKNLSQPCFDSKKYAGTCTWMGLLKRSDSSPWRRFDIKSCELMCHATLWVVS